MMSINGKVLGMPQVTANFTVPGFSQADGLKDLSDGRVAGGETEVENRGYEHQYVQVIVSDGLFENVRDIGSSLYCR